jgi:hypothetical protein
MADGKASSRTQDGRTDQPANGDRNSGVDQAFDRWLTHGLHVLFDPVVDEALPEDLLRLIDADRQAAARKG